MNKPTVNVIEVKEAPAIEKPEMMGGIRSKDAAANWGAKHGYTTVYLWTSRERVYADKCQRVDAQAKAIEQNSKALLQLSESGKASIDLSVIIGIACLMGFFAVFAWLLFK